MASGLESFRQIWLVDFEFCAPPGERPKPLCMVAREFQSDCLVRMWFDNPAEPPAMPFDLGPDVLYVAYYASAELGCHLALDWPMPARVLDLFAEFRNLTNGRTTPCGNGLLGALASFGLGSIDAAEKSVMRELAMRGGPFSEAERQDLLDYCQTDVDALAKLLPAMLPKIDLPPALLRGRYLAAAARMEFNGVPVDAERLAMLREHWMEIKSRLIHRVNHRYRVYVPAGQRSINPDSRFGQAILTEADASQIDPFELVDAVDHVWKERKESRLPFFDAKRAARQATGLTVAKINRWENQYRDYSSWPGLDDTARELAARFPQLGIGTGYRTDAEADQTDYAGALWNLLRDDDDRPTPKHDPQLVADAADIVARSADLQVWRPMRFSADRWARYLARHKIPWLRLESGALALDDDTFRQMARQYPDHVAPIRELRYTLGQLRLNDLAVGADGRNRCLLSVFRSKTGRNQPSNSRFIFGPSAWLRSLIQPEAGRAIAYVDWSQQEFGIAAAMSNDQAMRDAYHSADPYLTFAKQAGAVPPDATKQTHPRERSRFKICALAVQYGMGEKSLAQSLGEPEIVGRELLRLHRTTYPAFWRWSEAAVNHAMLYRRLHTVFGWRLHVGPDANPRSLANFPCQANGAEMLRLACCLISERGIQLCAPIHDAVLVDGPAGDIDRVVADTQRAMVEASEIILDGFQLRSDAEIIRWPDRYSDERGAKMWATVNAILDEIAADCEVVF